MHFIDLSLYRADKAKEITDVALRKRVPVYYQLFLYQVKSVQTADPAFFVTSFSNQFETPL